MITLTETIYIKANINIIWAYLTDFSKSLNFNRFHNTIELPSNYSIGKVGKFRISHNFGFGNYTMVAEIKDYKAPNKLSIIEYCIDDPNKGFPHKSIFLIEPDSERCKLTYQVSGTYGTRVQDLSFKPIFKGVIKEEIMKIKNAIESSESNPKTISSKTINPI